MKIKVNDYEIRDIFKIIFEWTELTHKEIASFLNCSMDTIANYSIGRRRVTVKTVLKMINTFNFNILLEIKGKTFILNDFYPQDILKLIRQSKNLTQSEFCRLINLNLSTYKNYETGSTNYYFDTLVDIVKKLDYVITIESN